MKNIWLILFAFLLVTFNVPMDVRSQGAASTPTFYALNSTEDASLWYLAFEEDAFMRSRLGEWISVALYRSSPGQSISWHLKKAYRKDNQCFLSLFLSGSAERKNVPQRFQWYEKGPDGELNPTIQNDQQSGEAFISFVQQDGSVRRFWIKRSRNLEDLSQSVKVTKAQPLWDWKNPVIGSL